MPEYSPIDDIAASLVGAVLFTFVIVTATFAYRPLTPPPEGSPNPARPPSHLAIQPSSPTGTRTLTPQPTRTPRPSPTPTTPRTPTARSIRTPQPSLTPTPSPTLAAGQPEDHYWFAWPIPEDGIDTVSRFYPYGSTAGGRYQVHHGVEFENPTGTPVLAVGPGQVVVAGSDDREVYGLFPDFYGNLVVIRHHREWRGQPVFTLYGHLSRVRVGVGQQVETGQIIGEVGETGIALGPHLHLEVRVGENSYDATRNPELWVGPHAGRGTLAGRVVDGLSHPLPGILVSLYDGPGDWQGETETYGSGVNPDEGWQENFVFGDLSPGRYTVQVVVDDTVFAERVEVKEGETAFVTLRVPTPVEPEPTPTT